MAQISTLETSFSLLLVEDDAKIRRIVGKYLQSRYPNVQIVAVGDGADGLQAFKEKKSDIVLTDIRMPVMDGLEMTRQIRALNASAQVIFFTARSDTDSLLEAVRIGVCRYVLKPLDYTKLFEAIEECLGRITMERLVKEQQEHIRKLSRAVEQGPSMVVITDAQGAIEYVNPKFCEITGFTAEEVIGCTPQLWKLPATPSDSQENLLSTITSGKEWRGELRNRKKNGELYWEAASISPLRNEDGSISHFIAVMEDVSEKKQEEEKLRDSEARFATIFRSGPLPCIMNRLDDGRIFDVNDRFVKTFGFSREETIGHTPLELELWANPEERPAMVDALRRHGRIQNLETRFRYKSGEIRHALLSLDLIVLGGELYILGTIDDISDRKQAEDLLQSVAMFPEEDPSPVLRLDRCGTVLYANRASRNFLEQLDYYRKGEVPEQVCQEVMNALASGENQELEIPCEDRTLLFIIVPVTERGYVNLYGRDISQLKKTDLELRTLNAELEQRVLESTAELTVRNAELCREITERLMMEQALAKSESRYRTLVETSSDWIWEVDAAGRYTYASPRVYDLLGYLPEEVIGRTPFDLMPSDEAARILDTFMGIVAEKRPFSVLENANLHRDGRMVVLESSGVPVFDQYGEFSGYRGIDRDVTERKRTEDELRQSEERYRGVVEDQTELISRSLPDGTLIFINSAYCSFFGKSPEELLGTCWQPSAFPDEIPPIVDRLQELSPETPVVALESRVHAADGSVHWMQFVNRGLFDAESRLLEIQSVGRDISEHIIYEQELQRARKAADDANRAKSKFLANMSHEIRTPMNGIIGMIQVMHFTELTVMQRKYLEVIDESAELLLSLIDDLLDLSKIESDSIVIDHEEFPLRESIDEVVRMQIGRASDKGLRVETNVSPEVPEFVIGDQLRLKQIMINLLGNAVKFTSAGEITITADAATMASAITVVHFSVKDTGIGILQEDLERIFDPFSQAAPSIPRDYGGTGLGLSICRRLAELMGGRIWVESERGCGSTFHVELPFSVRQTESTAGHNETLSFQHVPEKERSLKILLAEDNQNNVRFMQSLLSHLHHEVEIAEDGSAALEKWQHNVFDLILMDIQMPVMSGEEATRRIREQEKSSGAHIPIIALTAHALESDRDRMLARGFDGYLTKPLRAKDLINELQRCAG